jgi:hypothetical protein
MRRKTSGVADWTPWLRLPQPVTEIPRHSAPDGAKTTVFEAVRERLVITAGQPEAAHERLDIGLGLAQDTGDDAELSRLPDAGRPGCTPS